MTTRIGFVSLGCPKNLVDSEVMMGHLARAGAELVTDAGSADIIVVNTCGFIDAAREESVDAILEAAQLKTSGPCRRLVVAGCLVQRAHQDLARDIPEIDAFVGLDDIPAILGIAAPELVPAPGAPAFTSAGGRGATGLLQISSPQTRAEAQDPRTAFLSGTGRQKDDADPGAPHAGEAFQGAPAAPASAEARAIRGRATWLYDHESPRLLAGPRHSAYLKIAEGCDNPCAFCAIPAFRGAFRSRRLGSILQEAQQLAASGVRELNLIAQDSTHYGHDLGFSDGPARLLRSLDELTALRWIRLFYVYPNRLDVTLLRAMAECSRVVKYIDIPLQSGSRSVLARMKRGGSAQGHERLIDRMRSHVPDLVLRTTFIVGFPGETDAEFRETLDLMRRVEFDHVGAFTYSHEQDTSAFALVDDVPQPVKNARREKLLAVQESISRRRNRQRVGRVIEVLCEGVHPESDDLLVGRHAGQAPDIDGTVILNEGGARPGEFVRAKVLEAHAFDLVARILGSAEAA